MAETVGSGGVTLFTDYAFLGGAFICGNGVNGKGVRAIEVSFIGFDYEIIASRFLEFPDKLLFSGCPISGIFLKKGIGDGDAIAHFRRIAVQGVHQENSHIEAAVRCRSSGNGEAVSSLHINGIHNFATIKSIVIAVVVAQTGLVDGGCVVGIGVGQ